MEKCNKTSLTIETWDVDTHTILKVWLILYHQISTLRYSASHEKCEDFPINLSQRGKIQQNQSYRRDLRCRYSYFSQSMAASLSSNSHPMVFYITWEMHEFSPDFLIGWEDAAKREEKNLIYQ